MVCAGGSKRHPIAFGPGGDDHSDESDPGPMPIPLDVPIEGGSTAEPDPGSGDRHVLVMRRGDCMLFELFNTVRTGSGFQVSSSAAWDLTTNHTRPAGWTSADAAGLPTGTSDPGWEEALDQLREFRVRGSDFEVVASGPLTVC